MKRKESRKGNSASRRSSGDIERFPAQPSTYHDSGYRLSEADQREAAAGRSVFIRGDVLARVEYACRIMGSRELFFYYLRRPSSLVIENLYFPRQNVSTAHCEVEPSDVIRAGREIRSLGYRVVAAGHSHGFGSCFSSLTDWEQAAQLFFEAVTRDRVERERTSVPCRRVTKKDGSFRLRATLPGGGVVAEIAPRKGDDGGIDRVTFWRIRRVSMSSFATSNAKGEHIFPALEVSSCPVCGARTERRVDPAEIHIHVIGPVAISESDRETVRRVIKEKVVQSWSGRPTVVSGGTTYKVEVSSADVPTETSVDLSPPSPFTVTRYGVEVGSVEAVVLEEAAAKVPALARALGWDSSSSGEG